MAQPAHESPKKAYAPPTLQRREPLVEVIEGTMVRATTGIPS